MLCEKLNCTLRRSESIQTIQLKIKNIIFTTIFFNYYSAPVQRHNNPGHRPRRRSRHWQEHRGGRAPVQQL